MIIRTGASGGGISHEATFKSAAAHGDLLQDAWIDRIDVDLGTADRFLAEFCSWLSLAKRADAEPLAAGQAVQNLGVRGLQLRWHALALARIGYETANWKINRSKTGPTTAIGTSPQSAEREAKPLHTLGVDSVLP